MKVAKAGFLQLVLYAWVLFLLTGARAVPTGRTSCLGQSCDEIVTGHTRNTTLPSTLNIVSTKLAASHEEHVVRSEIFDHQSFHDLWRRKKGPSAAPAATPAPATASAPKVPSASKAPSASSIPSAPKAPSTSSASSASKVSSTSSKLSASKTPANTSSVSITRSSNVTSVSAPPTSKIPSASSALSASKAPVNASSVTTTRAFNVTSASVLPASSALVNASSVSTTRASNVTFTSASSPSGATSTSNSTSGSCKRGLGRRCSDPFDDDDPNVGPSGDAGSDSGGFGDDPDLSEAEQDAQYTSESDEDYITTQVDPSPQHGTLSGNRYLERLDDRITRNVPDDDLSDSEFEGYVEQHQLAGDLLKSDNVLKHHSQLKDMVTEMGISFDSKNGAVSLLHQRSRDIDPTQLGQATQIWSFSLDSKAIFADWSFKNKDKGGTKQFPAKSAYMLQRSGIDLSKVQLIGRVGIQNPATLVTIDTAFRRMPRSGPDNEFVMLDTASRDPKELSVINGILRTANGRGIVNLLAYFHQAFGNKKISKILLQRANTPNKAMMLVSLNSE